jgi:hypothetical protein
MLTITPNGDGTIAILVRALDDRRLAVRRAALFFALWSEGADTVRGSVTHPRSGTKAYIQLDDQFAALARSIDLHVAS